MNMVGEIVFITGGTSGLGRTLVDEFIENGSNVCFTYKNSTENANVVGN